MKKIGTIFKKSFFTSLFILTNLYCIWLGYDFYKYSTCQGVFCSINFAPDWRALLWGSLVYLVGLSGLLGAFKKISFKWFVLFTLILLSLFCYFIVAKPVYII